MKIKILNGLLIIDILTILLILAIIFISSSVVRIILGLPFLLFFPGYMLVAVLFINKEKMDGIEGVAISFGMSVAVVALIGFGLNYTSWGIRLEPVLYSVAAFIILMSAIALARRTALHKRIELTIEFKLGLPGWEGSTFNKSLSILLIVSILGALGVLGYTVVSPKVGEKFSEFYILGLDGKAQDYPTDFIVEKGQVTHVSYGAGAYDTASGWGEVTLGIVNREQQKVTYSVIIKIDDKLVNINYHGTSINRLTQIELQPDEKWEQEIGFAPQHIGNNQKVEFLLFKGDNDILESSLHLWINVTSDVNNGHETYHAATRSLSE
jgi:uncharacterized membrane protein